MDLKHIIIIVLLILILYVGYTKYYKSGFSTSGNNIYRGTVYSNYV